MKRKRELCWVCKERYTTSMSGECRPCYRSFNDEHQRMQDELYPDGHIPDWDDMPGHRG